MIKLLCLYAHLLATCVALGVIISTDLGVAWSLTGARACVPPPNRYVEALITGALIMLWSTGAGLIGLGLMDRPDFVYGNPKLQAKIVLVCMLTLNGILLHNLVFPRLHEDKLLCDWSLKDKLALAIPVALSNGLWMYAALLGIARPWSYSAEFWHVVEGAALPVLIVFGAMYGILSFAGWHTRIIRNHTKEQP